MHIHLSPLADTEARELIIAARRLTTPDLGYNLSLIIECNYITKAIIINMILINQSIKIYIEYAVGKNIMLRSIYPLSLTVVLII